MFDGTSNYRENIWNCRYIIPTGSNLKTIWVKTSKSQSIPQEKYKRALILREHNFNTVGETITE